MAQTPLFNVRLNDDLRGRVRAVAALWGTTESEAVRRILIKQTEVLSLSQLGAKALVEAEADAEREPAAA